MMKARFGKLYADKGNLSKKLTEKLRCMGIDLITKVKRNMKPAQHTPCDTALLRQRSLIETIFDALKNLSHIEHSRHRSVSHFIVNLLAGVIAYCLQKNKSHLPLQSDHDRLIPS